MIIDTEKYLPRSTPCLAGWTWRVYAGRLAVDRTYALRGV